MQEIKKTSDSDTEEETDSETKSDTASEDLSSSTEDPTFQPKPKGGRPNNTSHQDLAVKKQAKADLLNNVATDIQQLRGDMPLKRISCVKFDSVVSQCKVDLDIDPDDSYFNVSRKTIQKRIRRGNVIVSGKGPQSPVRFIEETLIDLLLSLSDMNKPLSVGEGVQLANELVEDKQIGDLICEWKVRHKFHCGPDGRNRDGTILGSNWWRRFMKKNITRIQSSKGRKFSCNREDWCTYDNFLNMYKCIYNEMLKAGVAEKIEVPVFMDKKGNVVSVENAFGRKCTHKLVRPDMCFVFDETGGNTCMKNDGHAGGKRYLHRPGQSAKLRASECDNHFTSLTVSSLTGEAALCVVIFKGEQADCTMFVHMPKTQLVYSPA